jgi:hypothetical protein
VVVVVVVLVLLVFPGRAGGASLGWMDGWMDGGALLGGVGSGAR